ncbi:hypothetical protein EV421DRAFT_1830240 [Armillaria borealis]|uniref:Uncharacterized protein n=1 Tax=Armillaria borealis TaxID=47425 RepID=A0AA39MJV1_9AGAR|nr:hypothetical protein EV421DRAFT_1830240 [Armillaria borealis]
MFICVFVMSLPRTISTLQHFSELQSQSGSRRTALVQILPEVGLGYQQCHSRNYLKSIPSKPGDNQLTVGISLKNSRENA